MIRARLEFLFLVVALPAAAQQAPDVVLTHGRIFTSDSTRPWAEALAIQGDRISAIGSTADVEKLAGPRTRSINLGGRTVIPGFNDAHLHIGLGWPGVGVSTGPSPLPDPDRALVADSVRSAVARVPRGTWLELAVASRILDDPLARRAWLDSLAPDHPVILDAWTGHGTVLNSRGLAALGISDSTRDPLGGWFERSSDGKLTGLAHEYAQYALDPYRKKPLAATEQIGIVRTTLEMAVRFGLTTLQNMETTAPEVTARVFAGRDLPLRVRVIPFVTTSPEGRRMGVSVSEGRPSAIGPMAYTSGIKYILDGTPVEALALMRRPYIHKSGWYGRLNFPVDTLRTILQQGLHSGDQLMFHAVGDSTISLVLTLMSELAPDSTWRARRVRLEHGDGLTPDLFPLARRLGVVVVQNPSHLIVEELRGKRYAPEVERVMQPLKSLLDSGIPLALGSDGPTNPFLNLMFATTSPNRPAEALSREQAVRAYTHGSAYAEGKENEKGILAPGMLADLAVLSQDIFTVPPPELLRTTSVLTLVGGRVVHDAGVVSPRVK